MKKQLLFILAFVFGTFAMQAQSTCSALYTYSANPNGAVTFTASNAMFNSPTCLYTWSLGNGATATGSTVTAAYNASGSYNVCLLVVDTFTFACSDSSCMSVIVNTGTTTGCDASFTYSVGSLGSTAFAANGASTNGAGTTYSWSFDNATTWTSPSTTAAQMNQTMPTGSTGVHLKINTPGTTCSDSTSQQVSVGGSNPCNASFYIYPDSNGAPSTYIGVNTSTGTGLSYAWTWGDGSTSTGMNPSHTYASPGTYNICLAVYSPSNCIDSFCLNSIINKQTGSMYSVTFGASPASTSTIKETSAVLYPNPTQGNFAIRGNANQTFDIRMMDVSGRLVLATTAHGAETVSIASLPNGLYAAQIKDQQGNLQTVRILKK